MLAHNRSSHILACDAYRSFLLFSSLSGGPEVFRTVAVSIGVTSPACYSLALKGGDVDRTSGVL